MQVLLKDPKTALEIYCMLFETQKDKMLAFLSSVTKNRCACDISLRTWQGNCDKYLLLYPEKKSGIRFLRITESSVKPYWDGNKDFKHVSTRYKSWDKVTQKIIKVWRNQMHPEYIFKKETV